MEDSKSPSSSHSLRSQIPFQYPQEKELSQLHSISQACSIGCQANPEGAVTPALRLLPPPNPKAGNPGRKRLADRFHSHAPL